MGFILLGVSEWPQVALVLFWIVIILSSATSPASCSGVWSCVPCLYTPMYFFLSNLSFLALHFICAPPSCTVHSIRSWHSWPGFWPDGVFDLIIITFQLPFCAHHLLHGFLCGAPVLILLVCGDSFNNEWQMTIAAVVFPMVTVGLILVSYVHMAEAEGKMKSEEGIQKVIATCSSHLRVVLMFYGTMAMVYTDPKTNFAFKHGKFFPFFYTVVTPVLSPLIYTLRNREVQDALQWKGDLGNEE
nr:olfactory receptor 2G2-like [Oryctolagus cuniculus]